MRTNLKKFFAFGVTTLVALAVASTAHADRRSSLAGNMLISDQDDIYVYPQLSLKYRNMVSFDYFPGASLSQVLGASSGDSNPGTQQPNPTDPFNNQNAANNTTVNPGALTGRDEATQVTGATQRGQLSMGGAGLLLFGQEGFAFGISSHREDIYGATPQAFLGVGDLQLYGNSSLSTWGYLGHNSALPTATGDTAPFGQSAANSLSFVEPLQMADLIVGFQVAPDNHMGARLSIGTNSANIESLGPTVETDDRWSTTALNLVLGYSLRSNFTLDLSLELGLAFFSSEFVTNQPTPNASDSGSVTPSFSLSGRSMIPLAESISLGVLGMIHLNTASIDDETVAGNTSTSSEVSSSNFMIELGAGPVYKLPDDTTIAAYGTVGFGSTAFDQGGGDRTVDTTAILLPGFKLAFEHWLWDWMAFRSGLSSRFYFQSQSIEVDDETTPNISSSHTYYEFLWSAGVGFKVGNFELNGTLQTPFVTNGPDFLGGTAPGLFSLLNANYKF